MLPKLLAISYRNLFLAGLLVATFLPTVISIVNFEILDKSVLTFVYMFALIQVLGTNHVWMTAGYYFNAHWIDHFKAHKVAFFWAPSGIMLGSIAIALQPNPLGWEVFGYGIILLNLWHHSRQNWGIFAMVGQLRQVSVAQMKWPLVWAWPFFLLSACARFPMMTDNFDYPGLIALAQVSSLAYFCVAMFVLVRSSLWTSGDPVILLFAVGLSLWFLPMALLYRQPYFLAVWVGAHALQYYLFVWVSLGLRDRPSVSATKTITTLVKVMFMLVALTAVAHGLVTFVDKSTFPDSLLVRLVAGIIAGVNLSHFWLDAWIWKFGNPGIRSLHGSAYSFS